MTKRKVTLPAIAAAAVVATGLGMSPLYAAGLRDGTYTGQTVSAYWGYVQVRAHIRHGNLAQVEVLRYPSDRWTSRVIAHRSLPKLEREVIAAQSTRVRYVSGASLTSRAFLESLQTALNKAG